MGLLTGWGRGKHNERPFTKAEYERSAIGRKRGGIGKDYSGYLRALARAEKPKAKRIRKLQHQLSGNLPQHHNLALRL